MNHVIKKAEEGAPKGSVRLDSSLSINTESEISAFILVICVFEQGEAVFRPFAPCFREVSGIFKGWFAAISTFANVLILLSSTDMSIK